MEKSFRRAKWRAVDYFLAAAIVIIPVLMTFQGYDLDDTGTHIYSAMQLFNPEVQTTSQAFYSNLITFIFYKIFSRFGLVSVFLLNTFIYILSSFIAVDILKDCMPRTYALAGALVSCIIEMKFIHVVSYNTYTVFFFMICCWLLYYATVKKKNIYFLFCGIVSGMSVFVRLPNLLICLLFAAFVYWAIVNSMKPIPFIKKTVFYAFGFAVAVVGTVVLIKAINKIFNANILLLGVFSSMDRGVSYSFTELLEIYLTTAFEALGSIWYIFMPIILCVCDMLCSRMKKSFVRPISHIVCCVAEAVFLLIFAVDGVHRNLLPVFCWIVLLITFIVANSQKHFSPKIAMLSLYAVIISVVTFAGSNTGITHANLCLCLAMPLCIWAVSKFLKIFETDLWSKVARRILAIGLCAVFVYNYMWLNTTYFEPTDRSEIIYQVDNQKLKGLYTSRFKAEYAQTATEVLSQLDNKYIIVYPGYDMIYYLSDKLPYTQQTGIFFNSYSKEKLYGDLHSNPDKELPVVFFSKSNPYDNSGTAFFTPDEKQQLIVDFMDEHSYTVYYSDNYMEIYTPTE